MLVPDTAHLWSLLFYLLCWHALADYALQPEWMAHYKSPLEPTPEKLGSWWWILTAHSLIQGFGVGLLTHWWVLGLAEAMVHGVTDYSKCRGWINATTDQAIHVGSKVVWAVLA